MSPSRLCERGGALHPPGAEGPLQGAGGGALQRGDRPGAGASAQGASPRVLTTAAISLP